MKAATNERVARKRRNGVPARAAIAQQEAEVLAAADALAESARSLVATRVKNVRRASDQFEQFERRHAAAADAANAARARIALEYDAIRHMARVAKVTITGQEIVVETTTLYIRELGKVYEIGTWTIDIPRGQDPLAVRVFPKNRRRKTRDGWYHPHVDANGKICFGSVSDHLGRALRESEYDVAVQFLIALLTTGRGQHSDWNFHLGVLRRIGRVVRRIPAVQKRRTRNVTDEAKHRAQRELYVQWCESRLQSVAVDLERERAKAEVVLTGASQDLLRAVREQRHAERVAVVIRDQRARRVQVAEEDFDALTAMPEIARIQPTDYGWCVVTTPLHCEHDGRAVEFGEFEIHVGVDGRLRVLNQTRRVTRNGRTWDHPVVDDGALLLPPEQRIRIARALAGRRLADAIRATIDILTREPTGRTPAPFDAWPTSTKRVEDGHGRKALRRVIA